jgi:hypothetical protein
MHHHTLLSLQPYDTRVVVANSADVSGVLFDHDMRNFRSDGSHFGALGIDKTSDDEFEGSLVQNRWSHCELTTSCMTIAPSSIEMLVEIEKHGVLTMTTHYTSTISHHLSSSILPVVQVDDHPLSIVSTTCVPRKRSTLSRFFFRSSSSSWLPSWPST